jgi:hypothetical protein
MRHGGLCSCSHKRSSAKQTTPLRAANTVQAVLIKTHSHFDLGMSHSELVRQVGIGQPLVMHLPAALDTIEDGYPEDDEREP